MNSSSVGRSSQTSRFSRFTHHVLLLLLCTSVGLNLLLAKRVRQLAATIGPPLQEPLRVGTLVPPITAKGLDGKSEIISYAGTNRLTVLYVFTPQCVWCVRNLDNVKSLLQAKGREDRFIGLSLTEVGLADYVRTNGLPLPVFAGLSSTTRSAYKMGNTPQTLVISPEGRILQDWKGAWTDEQKSEIEAFFHVHLPGLRLASSAH